MGSSLKAFMSKLAEQSLGVEGIQVTELAAER